MKLRKNDEVIVISGKHKGKTGKITKINTTDSTATIAGVNIVKKHVKPTQQNPDGGIKDHEAPIHISNVAYYVKGRGGGPTKIGFKIDGKKKKRINKTTGKEI